MDAEEDDTPTRNHTLTRVNSVEEQSVETVVVIEKEDRDPEEVENPESELDPERVEARTNVDSSDSDVVGAVIISPSVEAQSVNNVSNNRTVSEKVGKVCAGESKGKSCDSAEKRSCVIDISCGSAAKSCAENKWDGESVCRICHLSSDQSPDRRTAATSVSDLIHLGCGCKDDLGITHFQCAEAWFKLKGNRVCEICGETAKNVTGVGDVRFMEEWNEGFTQTENSSAERRRGCWRGQPFCNFLMACLVIAFVLPWFFRVNMF